jgi:hypothetical protein
LVGRLSGVRTQSGVVTAEGIRRWAGTLMKPPCPVFIQGGSNMTGTNWLVYTQLVPIIFEPPCIIPWHSPYNRGKITRKTSVRVLMVWIMCLLSVDPTTMACRKDVGSIMCDFNRYTCVCWLCVVIVITMHGMYTVRFAQ